jgi:hypothetical protein
MNGGTRSFDEYTNQRKEHISAICLKINKYLLWIPVLPSLIFATGMQANLKVLGLIRTLPGFMLIFGLLSYTFVYALSFALSPKYYEKHQYTKSSVISLSPLACLILAVTGHVLLFH